MYPFLVLFYSTNAGGAGGLPIARSIIVVITKEIHPKTAPKTIAKIPNGSPNTCQTTAAIEPTTTLTIPEFFVAFGIASPRP